VTKKIPPKLHILGLYTSKIADRSVGRESDLVWFWEGKWYGMETSGAHYIKRPLSKHQRGFNNVISDHILLHCPGFQTKPSINVTPQQIQVSK